MERPHISIVVPIYNEEGNILTLYNELTAELTALKGRTYEIIFINDGSKDESLSILKGIADKDRYVKVVSFHFNHGQTAAMSAGIKRATGEVILPMDGDLQNNPADISRFLEKLEEGYDVVSGWRRNRKDALVMRKVPSWVANWIIGKMTGVNIHDYGCSMKAYKREYIQNINLYGEMHRFIPAYVAWNGGKVTEIEVNHRPRIHGVTKYGISRTFKVILDLVVIKFLSRYMTRPMHFFGGLGFLSLSLGVLFGLLAIIFRLANYKYIIETPLPILSALLIIVGVQLVAMGVIAEMMMRTYFESQSRQPYTVKEEINF